MQSPSTSIPGALGHDVFEYLKSQGVDFGKDNEQRIRDELDKKFSYVPRIGVFGKTGAGKSSLCNALFGKDVCKVSDVEACTRDPQEVLVSLGQDGLTLVDVPGVGETNERDEEYGALYARLLPELDAIFWVLKADDRAYARDYEFFNQLVRPYMEAGKPFFIILNQADKIEPFREWQEAQRMPGSKQLANLEAKVQAVSAGFKVPASKVITASANERYNLTRVIEELVYALPPEQQVIVLREVKSSRPDNVSFKLNRDVARSLWSVVDRVVDSIPLIPGPAKLVYHGVRKAVDFVCDIFGW